MPMPSNNEAEQLKKIMNDTLDISKYILASKDDDEILTHIAKLINCDAYIMDVFGRLRSYSENAKMDASLFESVIHDLKLIELTEPVTLLDKYSIYPLKTMDKLTRRFVVFAMKMPEDLSSQLLIENMVNLLSLESMQVSINLNQVRQRRNELFDTILAQNLPENAFEDTLKLNGLDSNSMYKAFEIDEINSVDTGHHQEDMHRVNDYIYWYFEKLQIPIILISWHFKPFILVETKKSLLPLLNELSKFIHENFVESKTQIGYTDDAKPLIQFKKLLREADEALDVAKRENILKPNKFIPQQVEDILSLVPKKEADMFVDAILGPVLNLKDDEKDELIELLSYYYADNQSISMAANDLFIHRNTAVYRLKKLEKLLNMSLNDVSDSEQLRMATKLYLIHH